MGNSEFVLEERKSVNGNIPKPNPIDNQNVMSNYVDGEAIPTSQPPEVIEGVPIEQPAKEQSEFDVDEENQLPTDHPLANDIPNFEL